LFLDEKMEGWIIHKSLDKHFLQTMVIVVGMSVTMIAVALGIIYLFEKGLPMPAPVIILIFAIGFILGNVILERRGAIHSNIVKRWNSLCCNWGSIVSFIGYCTLFDLSLHDHEYGNIESGFI
jgi:RsiW-degrading membrane proteinase PrsW (M82 family)